VSEHRTTRPDHLQLLTSVSDDEHPTVLALEGGEEPASPRAGATIGVMIAADHALLRAGYRVLLELDERIEVVGEADSGRHAMALAAQTRPDVVLLELGLPGLERPDETERIVLHPAFTEAAVMIMTRVESDERVFSALRAGALGVLATDAEPVELRRAVQMLACGRAVLPATVMRRLIGEIPAQRPGDKPLAEQLEELTEREREVVALAGKGLTNAQIADRLVVSPATAKTHVSRAMIKLRARHRAELVVLAYETGLVLPCTAVTQRGRRLLAIA
jgi:DNA-binding NarL/FixJ family response regulator